MPPVKKLETRVLNSIRFIWK